MKKRGSMGLRRAQATVFIIIAIVIVAVIAIYFLITSGALGGGDKGEIVPVEIEDVHNYVLDCLKDTGEGAVYYIGQSGGYFEAPEFSNEYGIPYYYSDGKSYIPSIQDIEGEFDSYMNYFVKFCVGEFDEFLDYTVSEGEVSSVTKISEGKVSFVINYPISVTKNEKTYELKKFETQIQVRLFTIYNLAYNIIQEQLLNGDDICMNCMYDDALEKDLYIEMNDFGNKTGIIIYSIRDENLKIKDRDYRFIFANKFKVP
ncbi:hypothetical protein GOV12_02600 [Candidatus Pacearchaeota archaeon]|nr:hypothetical protein [Candidatus Pacearchaeota archaeon]